MDDEKIDFSKYDPLLCATGTCPICGAKMNEERKEHRFKYKGERYHFYRTVYTCLSNAKHAAATYKGLEW